MSERKIYLPEVIGAGYRDFWDFKGRYRVCKGSRASKKSRTTALNFIYRLMKYPQANLLVVRRYSITLKDSCYAELKWAIERLGVSELFECKLSPLEIVCKATGQKIYFRGLDDPLKITSITAETGYLCWIWLEEAYEISNESDFDMLDECIRGRVGEGLFKQITITFNPWNERHWLKRRFFDVVDEEIMAKTVNYLCNEFLDDADIRVFEAMRVNDPRRYRVAGLGEWGITSGLIYENWEVRGFELSEMLSERTEAVFGLDFGYTNDPSAFFAGIIDMAEKELYVFDEIYEKALSNEKIAERIREKGFAKERISADAAEPKSIARLRELGLRHIRAASKGKDSVLAGIDFLQGFKIVISPKCVNFIREISNYVWDKDRFGECVNKPKDGCDHLMDAMRYAVGRYMCGEVFEF